MSESAVSRTHWTGALKGRWPIALAVAVGTFTLTGDDAEQSTAEILPLLPLIYLVVAKLGRRNLTWPVLAASFPVTFGLQALDVVAPSSVFVAMALAVLVWGVADRRLFRDSELQLQTLGMVGFGTLALVGLAVDSDLGRFMVATGWLLHGVWDLVHFRRNRVVARSYAEWCGVLDLLIAFGLLFLV
jgi:uncharacterized membrane protein